MEQLLRAETVLMRKILTKNDLALQWVECEAQLSEIVRLCRCFDTRMLHTTGLIAIVRGICVVTTTRLQSHTTSQKYN